MQLFSRSFAALVLAACCAGAHAQVGLRRLTWPGPAGSGEDIQAAAWYPTSAHAQAMRFGPLEMTVAPGAPLPAQRRPLVVISHGAGGSEWAQAWLAQALAARGYLVVALRHAHDNQDDRSLQGSPAYFALRAAQVSRLLDALLADPGWTSAIDTQRIAVIGHSAGGATVLALAGARVDAQRLAAHCGPDGPGRKDDAAFCAMGGERRGMPPAAASAPGDARVRAVVAAVPVAAMFDPASLAAIDVPLMVENSARDEVLNPRHHGESVCKAHPQAQCTLTPGAGHGAFTQAELGRGNDQPGFDKTTYQRGAAQRLAAFLDQALMRAGDPDPIQRAP
jgi:predicted dienelactone hydrolase